MSLYEIEIKSLLGPKEKADELKRKMVAHPLSFSLLSHNKQLNHYFMDGSPEKLLEVVTTHLEEAKIVIFKKMMTEGKNHSVRTREANGKVILVVKTSLDDQTSSNGVSRAEFESEFDMSLAELDQILLDVDFQYQAKWSREREEYGSGDVHICIDKNAGYGYLVEFEMVISNEAEVESTKQSLYALMEELGVEELPQDRLERMFTHYNKHWPEYYGTEKVFIID